MMQRLEIGTRVPQFVGSHSGIMLDMDEYGGQLFFIIDEKHLGEYKLGGHYDFWCAKIKDVIFFGVKLGSNPHAAAPFSPHLSKLYTYTHYEKGKGMPLRIALISTADGIVKDFDFLVLGNAFSNQIQKYCKEIMRKPFNMRNYHLAIQAVYDVCLSDEDISYLAEVHYSID